MVTDLTEIFKCKKTLKIRAKTSPFTYNSVQHKQHVTVSIVKAV